MPEPFADDLDRHAGLDQQRSMGVAQVVQSDYRHEARRAMRSKVCEMACGWIG